MDFEQALIHELKVVEAFGNRIYPLTSPEAKKHNGAPYCIVVSSDGLKTKTLDGYQKGKSVPGEINVVTERYADLKLLIGPVIDILTGMVQRGIGVDGPHIQDITYKEPVELYEDKPALYRGIIEFEVYF